MNQLLDDIDRYCAEAGIKATTFGKYVANDGGFVGRLERQHARARTYAEQVYRYMDEHPPHGRVLEGKAA